MKNIFLFKLIIIHLLLFQFSWSQDDGEDQPDIPFILPQVAPLSPEAFAFQRYGDVKVNMFVGKPNINVPIYNIQGKEMNIPINLTYDAGGIKVEQLATWVGLGWNLNAGGIVTRVVNGRPDGSGSLNIENIRSELNQIQSHPSMHGVYDTREALNVRRNIISSYEKDRIDLEADVFKFSVNGFSGTVGIDYDTTLSNGKYRVFCLDKPDVEVTYSGSKTNINSWKIVDKNGVQYFFNAKEETRHSVSSFTNEYTDGYTSAWYLTKIISQNKQDTFDFIYSLGKYWDNDRYLIPNQTKSIIPVYNDFGAQINTQVTTTTINSNHYSIKQFELASIKHNNKTIITTSSIDDRVDVKGKKRLSRITIHTNPKKIKVNFEQSYFTTTNYLEHINTPFHQNHVRLKLDAIKFYDDNLSVVDKQFKFEYEDPNNLPSTISNSQDLLGYNNGKGNSHLVPKINSTSFPISYNGARRESVLSYTQKGILKRLHYPTGGHTDFFYELNQRSQSSVEEHRYSLDGNTIVGNPNLDFYCNEDGNQDEDDEYEYDNDEMPNKINRRFVTGSITDSEKISVRFYVTKNGQATTSIVPFSFYCIYKNTSPLTFCEIQNKISAGDQSNLIRYGYNITGTSTFNLNLDTESTYHVLLMNNQKGINLSLNFDIPIELPPINIGGLRVQKIISYTQNDSPAIIKKYKYDDPIFQPVVFFDSYLQTQFINGEFRDDQIYNIYSRNRSTIIDYECSYSNVSEITASRLNEEEALIGVTEYEFYNPQQLVWDGAQNAIQPNVLSGEIKEIRKYDKNKELQERTINIYKEDVIERIISLNGVFFNKEETKVNVCVANVTNSNGGHFERVEYGCPPPFSNIAKHQSSKNFYNTQQYSLFRVHKKLESSRVEKLYPDNDEDELVTKVNYYYDNSDHYQVTRNEVRNSNRKTLKTKYYYPHDLGMTNLINQHKIAIPIKSEKFIITNDQEEKLTTSNITFKNWGNDLILPQFIQSSKNTQALEKRIIFYDYDEMANPLEISKANGSRISYIWGYNKMYPIAKIENATYLQIASALNISIDELKNYNESNLASINSLRNSPSMENAFISTYTYIPYIGVTSMTDSRGYTMFYEYDEFNRLEFVKDNDDNLISENKYNYKK
ncbi:hypothetical protein [Aquimarina sp. AU119]|uniref:hypothetical protein n=1 Tax=Aquimarina sp. AU119 TaxID=2108528 RepID=UPI000D68D22F|nr:hypothetical protein [Aquimarina sp. AU119]